MRSVFIQTARLEHDFPRRSSPLTGTAEQLRLAAGHEDTQPKIHVRKHRESLDYDGLCCAGNLCHLTIPFDYDSEVYDAMMKRSESWCLFFCDNCFSQLFFRCFLFGQKHVRWFLMFAVFPKYFDILWHNVHTVWLLSSSFSPSTSQKPKCCQDSSLTFSPSDWKCPEITVDRLKFKFSVFLHYS